MKKFLSVLAIGFLFCLTPNEANAQRFGTTASSDNTGRVLTYNYVAPTYTATYALNPNAYTTIVKMGQLTGAQTVNLTVARSKVADRMTFIYVADGTDRVVTFATGFTQSITFTVSASTTASLDFVYNGTAFAPLITNDLATGLSGDGSAGAPGIAFSSDPDNGFYRIGTNHWAASVGGSKTIDFNTSGIAVTGTLSATGIMAPVINRTGTTYTATGTYTVTAAELAGGLLIAATSTATTTMVLPTTALMATQLGAGAGTTFDFFVSNAGGTNGTVTVAASTGTTASGFPGTNTLTLAGSATVGIAGFRITFISTTVSTLTRIN